jgi:hypothetical protein
MTEAANKEAEILAKIQKKEEADLKKYQEEMEQKNATPQSSATPSPVETATK